MKTTLLFFLLIICGVATAQVPNGGFETWTNGNPDQWATSNVFPIGLIPITQTTDKHSGNYALKGEVVVYMGTPMGVVIQSGPDATGFAISERYMTVQLYYKFAPQGGDLFGINIAFEKEGNVIAQGAKALPQTVSAWTQVSVPMVYTSDDIPDLAIIQISIVGPSGSDMHAGSTMYVDDVTFSTVSGYPEPALNSVTVYPNPATDRITFDLAPAAPSGFLEIIDQTGKVVKTIEMSTGKVSVTVEDLQPGIYFYRSGKSSGKFSVIR